MTIQRMTCWAFSLEPLLLRRVIVTHRNWMRMSVIVVTSQTFGLLGRLSRRTAGERVIVTHRNQLGFACYKHEYRNAPSVTESLDCLVVGLKALLARRVIVTFETVELFRTMKTKQRRVSFLPVNRWITRASSTRIVHLTPICPRRPLRLEALFMQMVIVTHRIQRNFLVIG